MGIFDAFDRIKYGQKVEENKFRKMLDERGLRLSDIHLPNLLNQTDTKNAGNPYQSPGHNARIPDSEMYKYFRVAGDKVEYFVQHVADSKVNGIWKPGHIVHAQIKLPSKKKSEK